MKQEAQPECPDFDKFEEKYLKNLKQQILRSNKKVIKAAENKLNK